MIRLFSPVLLLLAIACKIAASEFPLLSLDAKEPIEGDRRVPCTLRMNPASGTSGLTNALSAVARIHGGVSRGYPKKSYGLTLDAPVSFLGMRTSPHWVLNAAYIDRSLMRHKLSYDLFRSLSTPPAKRYSSASRFVEVQLNGQYSGVYLLMERVDRTLLELHSADTNAPSLACIYKAVDHSANFGQPGHAGYEQREPDPLTRPYWGPLDRFDRFVSRSTDADFVAPEKGISYRLDLDNAIDFHLLVLLTSNGDGITKNFILARDAVLTNSPPSRFFFVPWDYDGTFGRNWDATRVSPTAWLSNHLFDRLHSDAAFRKKFAAHWHQLRQREFSVATIHGLIDDNVRTLGEAARRNFARWPTQNGPYPDRLTFERDVAEMKEWVIARTKWLDDEIDRRAQP